MENISRSTIASSSSPPPFSSTSTSPLANTSINKISNKSKTTELLPEFATTFHQLDAVAIFNDTLHNNDSTGTQLSPTTARTHGHKLSTQTIHIAGSGIPSRSFPTYRHNKTQTQLIADEQDRIRAEFFATYDVMTGVRIAATLSGFFGLMVFLIVWKSRSSSNETLKVLKDPKMAAVAAVCMQEEEDREIHEAMVATGMSIYPDEYDAILYRRQRMLSLGNVSAPPLLNRGFRFSSVGGGGYNSLLEPTRRFSYSAVSGTNGLWDSHRKDGSESSHILSNNAMGTFTNDEYFVEAEDKFEAADYLRNGSYPKNIHNLPKQSGSTKNSRGFLEIPLGGVDSRRNSAITCCSTDSSYLERRCSEFALGLSYFPPTLQRKFSTASCTSSTDNWDYYYPDIQVVQATPKPSPCPSDNSLYDQLQHHSNTPKVLTGEKKVTSGQFAAILTPMTNKVCLTQKTVVPSEVGAGKNSAQKEGHKFVRKHSIAYYDPESAQSGRKQKIHSISADTVNVYPYNQKLLHSNAVTGGTAALKSGLQATPSSNYQCGLQFNGSYIEKSRPSFRGKIAVMELQRLSCTQEPIRLPIDVSSNGATFENSDNFPYSSPAAVAVAGATANSSSISMDGTSISIDKLNDSGSLGSISATALFTTEKRAPLASLSSFKISSLEYQNSEANSIDEDSVFFDSVADTDEDMRQLSSDSEEISLSENDSSMHANMAVVSQTDTPQTLSANQQSTKYSSEKCFSLDVTRSQHPLQQQTRNTSVCSSDRVSLIESQVKEFHQGSGTLTPTNIAQFIPLETHFGPIICSNSSSSHSRRAQLLQQYSDPLSLPTLTTTTTEEDTCSTLNTELLGGTGGGSVGNDVNGKGSALHIQHNNLNTVISFSQHNLLPDSNQMNYNISAGAISLLSTETSDIKNQNNKAPKQLPRNRLADDPCASSISDSIINSMRQPSVPPSLKNLILQGFGTTHKTDSNIATSIVPTIRRSYTNINLPDPNICQKECASPTVKLELPLIKLATGNESSESSNASIGNKFEKKPNKSEVLQDPNHSSTSKGWSKETLF